MRSSISVAVFGLGLLLMAVPGSAHHAAQAQYDLTKTIVLQGTCIKMEWINPHGYMQLAVKDETGKVRTWNLETAAPAVLRRAGLARGDSALKCDPFGGGHTYIARGFPARNGTDTAVIVDLKLPDGRVIKILNADEFKLPPNFEIPK